MLKKLKEELVQLHLDLPKNNLVAWTGERQRARSGDRPGGDQGERNLLRGNAPEAHGGR